MKEWIEPAPVEVSEALSSAVGGHRLVAETLARRGFASVEAASTFLDPDLYRPAPPTDLPNLVRAVERLERAVREGELICVWGDFDVDGQTATTLLVSALRDMGGTVRYHIPHRERESHGVNVPELERLVAEGIDLVLTCDTGVTAHEPSAYARSHGVDFIVTDHHDLPLTLPDAYAVVNPKMLPESHPLRELPGVGCAYKLVEALYERAGRPEKATQYLDLVALGIVGDVSVQTGDVRYLLQRGLDTLRHTERLGLQAMMEVAELNPVWLTEEHIGFMLAPRLNSLGRLDDANVAVEFLTTDDLSFARVQATQLEGLNAQRKLQCDQVTHAAVEQIEREPSLLEYGALVLSHASWPAGVIGIVAGRLAERYSRPAILISAPPDRLARGSARSVPGCDVRAAIAAHADLLVDFGGHPMAAGLAIEAERIPEFRRALSRTVHDMLAESDAADGLPGPLDSIQIDGFVHLADLSLDFVEQLERLAPFGPGNPALILASRGLSLRSQSLIGRSGEHLRLVVEGEAGTAQRVIWWRGQAMLDAGASLPQGRFDLAYVVRTSDYRGQRDVQVEWVDAREEALPSGVQVHMLKPEAQVVDCRYAPNPTELLERLRQQGEMQVWREAGAKADVPGRDRHELESSEALAVWTTPPGPGELRRALDVVSPETVYLFGVDPGLDDLKPFLERLLGLIKRALRTDAGKVRISALAAATAQRRATVRAGLSYLVAQGNLAVQAASEDGDEVLLAAGDRTPSVDRPQIRARLKALLDETAAYRAYFARADENALI